MGGAGTGPSTGSSVGYTASLTAQMAAHTSASFTSQVSRTLLTHPQRAYMPPQASSCLLSHSQMASRGLLWTHCPLTIPLSYSTSATEITQSLLPGLCGTASQTLPHPYILTVPNMRFAFALTISSVSTLCPRLYVPKLIPVASALWLHCLVRASQMIT